MATTHAELATVFVDTNIFIYAINPESPWHDMAQKRLEEIIASSTVICVNAQIIRECLSVLTRPSPNGTASSISQALGNIAQIRAKSQVLAESEATVNALLRLVGECSVAGKQVHDANIVATMIAHGVKRLLTHNISDFKCFSELIEIIPLQT